MVDTARPYVTTTLAGAWSAPIHDPSYVGARWQRSWDPQTMNEPAVVRAYSDPDCVREEERTCPRHPRREYADPDTGIWSCADCAEEQAVRWTIFPDHARVVGGDAGGLARYLCDD